MSNNCIHCWFQIKLASVKLAMKYMRRVSAELENVDGGPEEEELIVQGVRFAFRVHQVNAFFRTCLISLHCTLIVRVDYGLLLMLFFWIFCSLRVVLMQKQ